MSKFTCRIAAAVNNSPIIEYADTDALTHLDHQQIAYTLCNTEAIFAHRRKVGVIADINGDPELVSENLCQRQVMPAEIGGKMNDAIDAVNDTGCTKRNSQNRPCSLIDHSLNGLSQQVYEVVSS